MRTGPTPSRGCESGLRIEVSPLFINSLMLENLRTFPFFVGKSELDSALTPGAPFLLTCSCLTLPVADAST